MLINTLVVEAQGFYLLKKVLLNCSVSWLSSALKARDGLTGDVVPILGVIIRVPIPGFTLAPKSPAVTLSPCPGRLPRLLLWLRLRVMGILTCLGRVHVGLSIGFRTFGSQFCSKCRNHKATVLSLSLLHSGQRNEVYISGITYLTEYYIII